MIACKYEYIITYLLKKETGTKEILLVVNLRVGRRLYYILIR